jgi:hypothetical protein
MIPVTVLQVDMVFLVMVLLADMVLPVLTLQPPVMVLLVDMVLPVLTPQPLVMVLLVDTELLVLIRLLLRMVEGIRLLLAMG